MAGGMAPISCLPYTVQLCYSQVMVSTQAGMVFKLNLQSTKDMQCMNSCLLWAICQAAMPLHAYSCKQQNSVRDSNMSCGVHCVSHTMPPGFDEKIACPPAQSEQAGPRLAGPGVHVRLCHHRAGWTL